jgi:hypothetical protein
MSTRTKRANFGAGLLDVMKSPTFVGMLAAPLIGAAARRLESGAQERSSARAKAMAYREMIELHPHLKERGSNLPRLYNSLYNASPTMARDPLVAGAWIDSIHANMPYGSTSHAGLLNAVKDLTGIQKNVMDVERNRQLTPRSDKIEQFVGTFGKNLQDAVVGNLEAQRKHHNEQIDKQNLKVEAADARLRQVRLNEREHALNEREGRQKSSSLGAMLRALKV